MLHDSIRYALRMLLRPRRRESDYVTPHREDLWRIFQHVLRERVKSQLIPRAAFDDACSQLLARIEEDRPLRGEGAWRDLETLEILVLLAAACEMPAHGLAPEIERLTDTDLLDFYPNICRYSGYYTKRWLKRQFDERKFSLSQETEEE